MHTSLNTKLKISALPRVWKHLSGSTTVSKKKDAWDSEVRHCNPELVCREKFHRDAHAQ